MNIIEYYFILLLLVSSTDITFPFSVLTRCNVAEGSLDINSEKDIKIIIVKIVISVVFVIMF